MKHQHVLQAEGYCMIEGNLRWMVRNVDVCATYTHVFAFKIINLAAFVKNVGRMHGAIEQSKRYQTCLRYHSLEL